MPETPARVHAWLQHFEGALQDRLAPHGTAPEQLAAAMRYSVAAGGKRMRPLLVYAAADALGLAMTQVDGVACAVEIIHTYSLIHDDLPAMDDDDLRRGQPTCHRAFDEATAILAGDALQALAFEVLADDPELRQHPRRQVQVIGAIAAACGAAGMAGGQALDLASLNQVIDYPALERMHRLKTGALIRVSASAPAMSCAAAPGLRARLDAYGDRVGLAFQIHDDILDVTASSQQTGKPAQADAARNKPSFPSLIGVEESRRTAQRLCAEAEAQLTDFPGDTTALAWLARYAIERGN
jgi:farnesyl diphosphate synthase